MWQNLNVQMKGQMKRLVTKAASKLIRRKSRSVFRAEFRVNAKEESMSNDANVESTGAQAKSTDSKIERTVGNVDSAAAKAARTVPEVDMDSAIQDIPKSVVPELMKMRTLFGAMLPPDISYEAVKTGNEVIDGTEGMGFSCSYDEGYCGHFSIPGTDGAAASFEKVAANTEMLDFIEKHLVFPSTSKRSGLGQGELVIHSGGLNTLHSLKPAVETEFAGETTTPQRLQHYIDTLGCPMAQLHMGTDMDQGAITIEASDSLLEYIESIKLQLALTALTPEVNGNIVTFSKRQRDRLEALYSTYGYARPLWQDHIVALLKENESAQKQLVFMPYSRSTSEMASALRRYIREYVARVGGPEDIAEQQVEAQLFETVTVVTIGNTDRKWPDGPAYVHVSGKSEGLKPRGTDQTVLIQGVHSESVEGAGRGAVFLHSDWVFSGFDAHNFAAAGAAVLRLTMAMNDLTRWRQLWGTLSSVESSAKVRLPSYEEAAAGTAIVGGQDWLWFREGAFDGVKLPSKEEAVELVGGWMGLKDSKNDEPSDASGRDDASAPPLEGSEAPSQVDTEAPPSVAPESPKRPKCTIM